MQITREATSVAHLKEMIEGYTLLFGAKPSEIYLSGTFVDAKGVLLFTTYSPTLCVGVGRSLLTLQCSDDNSLGTYKPFDDRPFTVSFY